MKKSYNVTCTVIYNGCIDVEAESNREAMSIAEDIIINNIHAFPISVNVGDICFNFGEGTVDYADCNNDNPKNYTVWVGGVEANDHLMSKDEADLLACKYKLEGYDDVVVDVVL